MKTLILIFFGGGIGSVLRFIIQTKLYENLIIEVPWATLLINIAGSFFIGAFYVLSAKFNFAEDTRLFLTTGLCGGFTTFSAFSIESLNLLKSGNIYLFILYIFASILLCLIGVFSGQILLNKFL